MSYLDTIKRNKKDNEMRIHSILVNDFHLSPMMRESLDIYYMLHWTKEYLDKRITIKGTIIHADVEYIPIFKCPNVFDPAVQMKLSFRKPKAEFNIPAYVLIKEVK